MVERWLKRFLGRQVVFNAASQLGAFGFTVGIQTVYMIIAARMLGPEDFGRYSFAWSLIQIFLISGDLGVHHTAIREVSSNPRNFKPSFANLFWLKLVLSFFFFLLIFLTAFVTEIDHSTRYALFFFGIGMVLHSLSVGLNVLSQAQGKLYLASFNICILFLIQFILGVGALVSGGRVVALAVVYVAAAGLSLILNLCVFHRKVHSLGLYRPEEPWEFLKRSLAVGMGNLMKSTSLKIGVAFLTLLVGAYETGIFSAGFRITATLMNIPVAIVSAVLPVFAAHQANPAALRPVVRKSVAILILTAAAVTLFALFGADFLIALIYGAEYQAAVAVFVWLAWSLIPQSAGLVFENVLASQNSLVGRYFRLQAATLIIHLLLCVLLIPKWGPLGLAWTVIGTEMVRMVLAVFFGWRFLWGGRQLSAGVSSEEGSP